jgi:cytidine deaminase
MTMDDLIANAKAARANAYCPYSNYPVGCAIQSGAGAVFAGCNIENVSYGLAICAERAAVSQMVTHGNRDIQTVVVVTRDGGTPCGMCLQTLLEFSNDPSKVKVLTVADSGIEHEYTLHDLLPHAFNSTLVKAKQIQA